MLSQLSAVASAELDLAQMLAFHEEFDGPKPLRGIVKPGREDAWLTELADGKLLFVNDKLNSAVRFYDIPTVEFPLQHDRSGTDGTEPAASVRVEKTGDGGVGVLVGYPHGGDYAVFAISGLQRYAVLKKTDGRMERLHHDSSDAVVAGGYNDILVTRRNGRLGFVVNGVEVFDMPADDLVDAPVGIVAYGRGRYAFESVSVRAPDEVTRKLAADAEACDLPAPDEGATTILLGAYEGAALSSVSVAGQDERTSTIGVFVEAGDTHLHLVVAAYDPVIWNITGAVSRVSHFATIGRGAAAGVVGISEDKVSFHDSAACAPYFYETGSAQKRAEVITAIAMGRVSDILAGHYNPAAFSIPGGAVIEADDVTPVGIEPGWDEGLVQDLHRFSPAGIVAFEPADVVSKAPAEAYDVLPQQAGLAQLVAEGVLVRESRDTFRAVKPMRRYPAGLAGAHSVRFIIPYDQPEPLGWEGHSKVIREFPVKLLVGMPVAGDLLR